MYKNKYLKYKSKYLQLKGGMETKTRHTPNKNKYVYEKKYVSSPPHSPYPNYGYTNTRLKYLTNYNDLKEKLQLEEDIKKYNIHKQPLDKKNIGLKNKLVNLYDFATNPSISHDTQESSKLSKYEKHKHRGQTDSEREKK